MVVDVVVVVVLWEMLSSYAACGTTGTSTAAPLLFGFLLFLQVNCIQIP
jgi:hypothetical protein